MSTPKEIFAQMKDSFAADPNKVEGIKAVYQFKITGDNGGNWFADSTGDAPVIGEGEHENPSVTITCADQDFVDIKTGKLNGQMAFMTGKLKISGDMGLAMKLQKILG